MGLSGKDYVVLSDGATLKRVRDRESWPEILRRWIVKCPQCSGVWLVVGAHEGDSHVCRDCGHSFAIKLQVSDRGRDASDRRGLT
jgi:rRNA maturation endonuclease Nob1